MKKIISLSVVLSVTAVFILSFTSCTQTDEHEENDLLQGILQGNEETRDNPGKSEIDEDNTEEEPYVEPPTKLPEIDLDDSVDGENPE